MSAKAPESRGDLDALQRRLRYRFTDVSLLEKALDLRRISAAEGRSYDRFEKIGDRLLYPIALRLIEEAYPSVPLCEVTRMERVLTTNQNLAHLAIRLDLMSVMVRRYPNFVFVEKTLADLLEAICAAIATDAGSGDYLEGIPRLRTICKHLFTIDLALSQIDNPVPQLFGEAKNLWGGAIRHHWVSINYDHQPIGYTCKLMLTKRIAKSLGIEERKNPFIAGTGVTTEQALRKAAALALLKLHPQRYVNSLPELRAFSWRIKAAR